MKMRYSGLIFVLVFILGAQFSVFASPVPEGATKLYVSVIRSNRGDGSIDKPYKDLQRAIDGRSRYCNFGGRR